MTDYKAFRFTGDSYMILCTTETYQSTKSRENWKTEPSEIENEIVTPEFYTNYITSVPFFKNFGDGADCKVQYAYTVAGYLPTKIITKSPFRLEKKITRFEFVRKELLLEDAGAREREIVEHAVTFRRELVDGVRMIRFFTNFDGVTSQGLFDTSKNAWRA